MSVPRAFISYVREDANVAGEITRNLQRNGIGVWRDKDELAGGMRWKTAIRNAIRDGTYFLSVHSENRVNREVTYANEELIIAIEELRKRPQSKAWLIPLRVDNSEIEDRPIGGGEMYMDLHVHDLTEFDSGILSLLRSFGVEEPVLAEKKHKRLRDEFTAPQGSPFTAVHALQELSTLPVGTKVTFDSMAAAFGENTIRDLSKLKMISSKSRGEWELSEPVDDAKLALAIAISKIPAFQVVVSELKKDFSATGWQLGEKISEYLGREWSRASCQRNGQAYKKWAAVLYPNFRLPQPGESSYLLMRSTASKSPPKGRSTFFTPDVLLQISAHKRAGKNIKQIAKIIGCVPSTIGNWKRDNPENWKKL